MSPGILDSHIGEGKLVSNPAGSDTPPSRMCLIFSRATVPPPSPVDHQPLAERHPSRILEENRKYITDLRSSRSFVCAPQCPSAHHSTATPKPRHNTHSLPPHPGSSSCVVSGSRRLLVGLTGCGVRPSSRGCCAAPGPAARASHAP
jgi:hypothetical protein